MNFILMNL